MQAFAARDIARRFLDHSHQFIFNNLGDKNCYFKIFRSKCVLYFKPYFLAFLSFFNFLCWKVESFILGVVPGGRPRNLVRIIIFQTSYFLCSAVHVVSLNFLCSAVYKFWVSTFFVQPFTSFFLWSLRLHEDPNFVQINCLPNISLHCEF